MSQRNASCSFCRKNYRDVGPLVEGPGDVYICGECIPLCQSIIDQEQRRRGRSPVPWVEAVRRRLRQVVISQEGAREALVQAALRRHERSGQGPTSPVLLIGPTRSSKLFLARALAHALEAPFAAGDGDALVRTAGANIEPLLLKLFVACDFVAEAAHRGVVYVDGADQRATQERLLHLWEGAVSDPLCRQLQIDVGRILFLCGGEFAGLDAIAARLGRHPEQAVTGEALLAFGAAPDLVKRLEVFVKVAPLDDDAVARLVPWVDFAFAGMTGGKG